MAASRSTVCLQWILPRQREENRNVHNNVNNISFMLPAVVSISIPITTAKDLYHWMVIFKHYPKNRDTKGRIIGSKTFPLDTQSCLHGCIHGLFCPFLIVVSSSIAYPAPSV